MSDVDLREYIERIIDERHAQYEARFQASEQAVRVALEAKKHTAGIVLAVILGLLGTIAGILGMFIRR